jgi:succinoglycan biosynthesis protein ExoM
MAELVPRVCIGIPTFKRPGYLRLLLRSLEKQTTIAAITVVVADNDTAQAEGRKTCAEVAAEGYRYPLVAVPSTVPGIANTRNTIVETALKTGNFDYIAMIDDDSWPEPDWLTVLLALIDDLKVDLVRGAMRPEFEVAPEPWLVKTGYFQSSYTATGRIDQIHAGGNFLARAEVFSRMPSPWFSSDYALTGGEDDDFFLRLKELGCTFAQSVDSIVYERMPPARCNAGWLKQRALMNGASWANVRLRRRPRGWSPALEVVKIVGGFVFGVGVVCVFFWSRHRAFRGVYQIYRAVGKVRGMLSMQRQYYNLPPQS